MNTHTSLKPSMKGNHSLRLLSLPAFIALAIGGVFLVIQSSSALYFIVTLGYLCLRFPSAVSQFTIMINCHPWFYRTGGLRTIGPCLGTLLFWSIIGTAEPVQAQIFDTAEDEVDSIFGEYLESEIITFLFGLIRVVIWVSAVGFVFFAIYQAQRGEQWQPLAQNAFIIVAAVVLVEGLSALFFGDGAGGGGDGGAGEDI